MTVQPMNHGVFDRIHFEKKEETMKKRLLATMVIAMATLMLSGCSIGNQTGTVGVAGGGASASQRILDSTNQDCQKIIDTLNKNLASLTPQKADPDVLSGITVEYYGASKPISDVAAITVEQGNVLVITPHDMTNLGNIEKAIRDAGIGVTPENDGKRVTLTFPRLTGELRNERLKEIANIEEQAKIQIRDVRKAKLNKIKEMARSGEITPDEKNDIENKLQRTVDEYNNQVQELVRAKKDQVIER